MTSEDRKNMYPEDKVMAAFITAMTMAGLFFWGWALITAPVITLVVTVSIFVAAKKIYPLSCHLVDKFDA